MVNQNADKAARWALPDSAICAAAYTLADEVSPPFLHNHCVRSYLFGRELAAASGLRAGVDYDDETVFLATILHDLGITGFGSGEQRFEVDGADAAAGFLRDQGCPEDQVTVVWQSIALHTSVGLGHRFGTDHAVCHGGIDLDVVGARKDVLPSGFADRVHDAWPRHNLGFVIAEAIARDVQADPRKAPPFSFPGHVHHLFNDAPSIDFADLVAGSGWADSFPQDFHR